MATKEKTENKTKVLVNVYEPLIEIMKRRFEDTCLKRDAYLDKALKSEAGLLKEEVTVPNSDKARSYIAENLKKLKLKPLNLLLSTDTVELINEVCKEKNIPRDAFINRFFLLLIASDTVIDALFFSLFKRFNMDDFESWNGDWKAWSELGSLNRYPLMAKCFDRPNIIDSIEDFIEINPFWRLRDYFACYEENWKMYGFPFEKNALNKLPDEYSFLKTDNILGFNTFMTDEEVSEQEDLDKPISVKKAEVDKLLAFAKKEKQTRSAKTKPSGEAQ
jgi:hypothetical protein